MYELYLNKNKLKNNKKEKELFGMIYNLKTIRFDKLSQIYFIFIFILLSILKYISLII